MLNPVHECDVLLEWIDGKSVMLDLAFCIHIPNSLKWREQGWDDIWLAGKLKPYFASLDMRVARSYTPAFDRVVVLHHSHSVGWHAHFQVATPPTMTQLEFAQIAYRYWKRTLGRAFRGKFQQSLLWSEPVIGDHMPYMLRHLSIDRVDWENTHFTGSVE